MPSPILQHGSWSAAGAEREASVEASDAETAKNFPRQGDILNSMARLRRQHTERYVYFSRRDGELVE
jgi:hypothetical protein